MEHPTFECTIGVVNDGVATGGSINVTSTISNLLREYSSA